MKPVHGFPTNSYVRATHVAHVHCISLYVTVVCTVTSMSEEGASGVPALSESLHPQT